MMDQNKAEYGSFNSLAVRFAVCTGYRAVKGALFSRVAHQELFVL